MKRRLNETRVGEYRSNLVLNVLYTLISILAIVALFIVPITYIGDSSFPNLIKESPINYLIDHGIDGFLGYFSIAVVILFGYIFTSSYLCFSIPKLGKSVFIKISKIVELIMMFFCFVILSFALYMSDSTYIKGCMIIYFAWELVLVSLIVLCLLNYFKIKKISIYD